MNNLSKIKILLRFIKNRIINKKYPFYVLYRLTDKCNSNCIYCEIPNNNCKELNYKKTINLLKDLIKNGLTMIALTGGEPLLRKDIDRIISYLHSNNIIIVLITNGLLIEKHINSIKKVNFVLTSLDGPEKIHDMQRGKGTYKQVLKNIDFLNKLNKRIIVSTVITKNNYDKLDHIYKLSIEKNFLCSLNIVNQFCESYLVPSEKIKKINIDSNLIKKNIIKNFLNHKDQILSSDKTLNYILSNGDNKTICYAGKYLWNIEPNGFLSSCIAQNYREKGVDCYKLGFKKSSKLVKTKKCSYCFTHAFIDINNFCDLNLSTIIKTVSIIKKR